MSQNKKTGSGAAETSSKVLSSVNRSKSSRLIYEEGGGGTESEDEAAARKSVLDIFKNILHREPSEAEFFHFRGCILDGELNKDDLKQQIARSFESCIIKDQRLRESNIEYRSWTNPFYPWVCVEDGANEQLGTIRWDRNQVFSETSWFTKDIPPGNCGAQIIEGKLYVCNLDVWNTVAVSEGLSNGIHCWNVKKKSRLCLPSQAEQGYC